MWKGTNGLVQHRYSAHGSQDKLLPGSSRKGQDQVRHSWYGDISAHVERDNQIHIEYVPTQVVSEYLRHLFRDADGAPVAGLAWEWARRSGARNVVLFLDRDRCVEPGERPALVEGLLVELVALEPAPLGVSPTKVERSRLALLPETVWERRRSQRDPGAQVPLPPPRSGAVLGVMTLHRVSPGRPVAHAEATRTCWNGRRRAANRHPTARGA